MPRALPGAKYLGPAIRTRANRGHVQDRTYADNPHILIEGMIIAGYSMGIPVVYNYIHGEIWAYYDRFKRRWKKRAPPGTSAKYSSAPILVRAACAPRLWRLHLR